MNEKCILLFFSLSTAWLLNTLIYCKIFSGLKTILKTEVAKKKKKKKRSLTQEGSSHCHTCGSVVVLLTHIVSPDLELDTERVLIVLELRL